MTETYSKSADFPNGLAPGQLATEIIDDVPIITELVRIDVNGDVVNIVFASTISNDERTELDILVANHVPYPFSNNITSATGYIELNSSLADAQSININASNAAGGIVMTNGTGGFELTSANQIALSAAAASNFTTSSGNIGIRSTPALVNIDGGAGINIGSIAEAQPINIGTPAAARTITIGNATGATSVSIDTGTGGFLVDTASGGGISLDATGASCNFTLATTGAAQDLTIAVTGNTNSSVILSSAGTGSDAIKFDTTGGIRSDATGDIYFASGSSAGGAITLDAAFNNGGINISAGSQGVAINSTSSLVGIGHWSGGDIQIGTAAVARTVTIGNSTGTTAVAINTGTGHCTISTSGTGNIILSSASNVFARGTNGEHLEKINAETSLGDANTTLTISQLRTGYITQTPSVIRTLTLPTAANVVAGIGGVAVGDSFKFSIANLSSAANDISITVATNTGVTMVGPTFDINAYSNLTGTYFYSGVGKFRVRITNIGGGTEAYTIYRL